MLALVRVLRPEAAHWLPVSGSLYAFGGFGAVVGAVVPTRLEPKARIKSLALAVCGLYLVLTFVQFISFISRPDANVPLFLWNFVRWILSVIGGAYAGA